MKKLLIIITLFVSSFFLFCNKDVKAYEYTKEVDFSIMDDVLALKENLDIYIETDTTLSDYYFITYESSVIYYYVLPVNGSIDLFTIVPTSSEFRINSNQSLKRGSNRTTIKPSSGVSNKTFYICSSSSSYINDIILYSNFDIKYSVFESEHSITYNYQDFSYTENFVIGNKISTLYDVYLIYSGTEQENPNQEEIDKVTNFYTIVIKKIEYLANEISNNYILLFVIGIFIVTFLFLLIFRRFL